MAIKCGFFNSINHDRAYNANDMSEILASVITDGVFDNYQGLFAVVVSSGMNIIVRPGRAWFNNTWTTSDSDIRLTVPAADVSMKRIDAVVLEVNHSNNVRNNTIKIVKGTPAASPKKPTLANGPQVFQHPLAYITLSPRTSALAASMIDQRVGKEDCPFVTSVLTSVSIDELFAKWEEDFTNWFDALQSQMSGDVAGNLLNKINTLNAKVDDHWLKTLSSDTKKLYGFSESATPDDVFLLLKIGETKRIINITLLDPYGNPVPNATIYGAPNLLGEANGAVTDANGRTKILVESGKATSISADALYDDWKKATKTVANSSLTPSNETLQMGLYANNEIFTLNSGIRTFSPQVKEYDLTVVGGGGGGYVWIESLWEGGGGGGGYASFANKLTTNPIKVSIGSRGKGNIEPYSGTSGRVPATKGGTTTVVDPSNNYLILQALGGNPADKHNGGTGNGNGGRSGNSGTNGTVHLFGDPSLELAGGGGGGGGCSDSDIPKGAGGEPNGGRGSFAWLSENNMSVHSPSISGGFPGGGAGGGKTSSYSIGNSIINNGNDGGLGGCWIRVRR